MAIGRVTKSDLLRLLLDLPQNRPRTSRECRETALYDEEMVEIVIPPNLLANLNLQCRIGICARGWYRERDKFSVGFVADVFHLSIGP